MSSADAGFSGAIPAIYDRCFGPALFGFYGERLAERLHGLDAGAVLEIAAGTGIVTEILARRLPPAVALTATDLNQPMLDHAAAKPGLERVVFRQADAMRLPFPDAAFDAVLAQFGVMFFPDRIRAHAEALRVLRPGGRYLFNVWDRLDRNPAADIVQREVAALYPDHPPGFLARTPFGYHDEDRIRADLSAGGFRDATIETLASEWAATSPQDPAVAFCQGSPFRAEIEAVDPAGPARATASAASGLAARFGTDRPRYPTRALMVEARKPG